MTNVPSVTSFATRHPAISHATAAPPTTTTLSTSTSLSLLSTTRQIPKTKATTANYRHVLYMTSDAAAIPAEGGSDDDSSSSASSSSDDDAGGATVTQLIFNLVKGIVGAGVLSLPAGIAAWGSGKI